MSQHLKNTLTYIQSQKDASKCCLRDATEGTTFSSYVDKRCVIMKKLLKAHHKMFYTIFKMQSNSQDNVCCPKLASWIRTIATRFTKSQQSPKKPPVKKKQTLLNLLKPHAVNVIKVVDVVQGPDLHNKQLGGHQPWCCWTWLTVTVEDWFCIFIVHSKYQPCGATSTQSFA